jgi:hypothetical protein
MECIRSMYNEIMFCVTCSYEQVTEVVKEETGVRQGSSLSPYLFTTFIKDIISITLFYIKKKI